MAKAVLISRPSSRYDDLPEERYHFPKQYLSRIKAVTGDWIIYYEPRRNSGRMVYYATAQVKDIHGDPHKPGYYYAEVDHYLEFENPVPLREGGRYYLSSLLNPDGTWSTGKGRSAVQPITEAEYQLILQTGFAQVPDEQREAAPVAQPMMDVPPYAERLMVRTILNRPFRDRAFAAAVKTAYDKTCAVTGLRLINGGGRPEVQAAHIRPVADQGPDSVRNGIALCGTVHWMFDRGLISLNDDYEILKAGSGIPQAMDRMFPPEGELTLPDREDWRPHPCFLKYHRAQVFKG